MFAYAATFSRGLTLYILYNIGRSKFITCSSSKSKERVYERKRKQILSVATGSTCSPNKSRLQTVQSFRFSCLRSGVSSTKQTGILEHVSTFKHAKAYKRKKHMPNLKPFSDMKVIKSSIYDVITKAVSYNFEV